MEPENHGWGSKERSGVYLSTVRQECVDLVRPKTTHEMRANVTGCMLNKFTELDKALSASRQYFLTLWPAFVGFIVALAPDPACMVFDNIWWSILFALTCGGLPGISSASPAHHIEAASESEGRALCESWEFNSLRPKEMSKEDTMGSSTRGAVWIRFEWFTFLTSIALWLSFCIYFGHTLYPVLNITFESVPVAGALWFYLSAGPAILEVVLELFLDRVNLYEPASEQSGLPAQTKPEQRSALVQPQYFRRFEHRSVVGL